ncbi:hypothetical protein OROMI_011608 [Orobanche minor]
MPHSSASEKRASHDRGTSLRDGGRGAALPQRAPDVCLGE